MEGRIKTDVVQGKGLPQLGTIRIGEKRKNASGVEYPVSLDYFVVPDTSKYKSAFMAAFPENPSKIPVVFYSDDLNIACKEEFTCWEKQRLVGSGDGVDYRVWSDQKKEYVMVKADDPLLKGHVFKRQLTLRFIIPTIKGVLGHWTFVSGGGKSTVPNITSAFDLVREKTGGTIIGFPFDLVVKKAKGYNPGDQKNFSVVDLVPNFSEKAIEIVRNFMKIGDGNLAGQIGFTLTNEKLKAIQEHNESQPVKAPATPSTIDAPPAGDIKGDGIVDVAFEEIKKEEPAETNPSGVKPSPPVEVKKEIPGYDSEKGMTPRISEGLFGEGEKK